MEPAPHVLGAETGTPFGWHYYSCFRECPRNFYYKHVLNLEPLKESAAKRRGRIFHSLKEKFYTEHSEAGLNDYLEQLMLEATADGIFGEFDPPEASKLVIGNAFSNWLTKYGRQDLEDYDILGVEQAFDIEFQGLRRGFLTAVHLTGRLDLVMRNRVSGELDLVDTKTSGSTGPDKTFEHTDCNDQLSVYAAAVNELYGELPTCMVDAVLLKGSNPQVGRASFFRSIDEISDTLHGLVRTKETIEEAATLLEDGSWKFAYPRHPQKCSLWGCEYEAFCRNGVESGQCPPGFYVKETSK